MVRKWGLAGAGSLHPAMRLSNRRREMARSPRDTAGFVARRGGVAGTSRDGMHKAIAPVSQSKVCARAEDYVRALCSAVRPWSQSKPSADFCSDVAIVGGISATAGEQQAVLAQFVV